MGSKRTLVDSASETAAEVQAGPHAAAAAADPQPSSSEQPFVNTGAPGQMKRLSTSYHHSATHSSKLPFCRSLDVVGTQAAVDPQTT